MKTLSPQAQSELDEANELARELHDFTQSLNDEDKALWERLTSPEGLKSAGYESLAELIEDEWEDITADTHPEVRSLVEQVGEMLVDTRDLTPDLARSGFGKDFVLVEALTDPGDKYVGYAVFIELYPDEGAPFQVSQRDLNNVTIDPADEGFDLVLKVARDIDVTLRSVHTRAAQVAAALNITTH